MEKIEREIKEFSSKKLKEIIEQQSNAYSEIFIDYAKNELIRRGETFLYDIDMQDKVKKLSDEDLKKIVESDRENYHLEYLELAIKEYLVRGFKNETEYVLESIESETNKVVNIEKRYPTLRAYSSFYFFIGLLF